jgi:hypothetical protein
MYAPITEAAKPIMQRMRWGCHHQFHAYGSRDRGWKASAIGDPVKAVTWLIITQILAVLSLLPWLVMAGLSLLAFDTGYELSAVLFVGVIWLYPLLPLGCAIRAWWLYRQGRLRGAIITTSIPLVLVLPLVLYGTWALLPHV